MKSSPAGPTSDREKTGGIYAGVIGFTLVWLVGFLNGVPFRDTIWKGIGCAIVLYVLTTFLLRILLRLPEEPAPPAPSRHESGAQSGPNETATQTTQPQETAATSRGEGAP